MPSQGSGPQQPAPVTIAQGLLVVQAVLSVVGLLVVGYTVSVVIDFATRLSSLGGSGGLGGLGTSTPAADTSGITVAAVLSVVEVVSVVAGSLWAFRAIGQRRPVARIVLASLAAVQVLLTVVAGVVAGVATGFVVVVAVVGLLVFDVPVLVLLLLPADAAQWFRGAEQAGPAVVPSAPFARPGPAPYPAGPTGRGPGPGAPPSAPFPTPGPSSAPFPAPGPPGGPSYPRPGGRHASPRSPQS